MTYHQKQQTSNIITGPTCLTLVRMILAIAFFVFLLTSIRWAQITALILFVIAAITDKIDGYWARRQKIVTDIGAFLDPLADKMLVNLAFLALCHLGIVPLWIFAIILVRDFAVDGLRMISAQKNITIPASNLGKAKTTLQMIALIVILINVILDISFLAIIGNIFLYIALVLTIVSGIDYLAKGGRNLLKK